MRATTRLAYVGGYLTALTDPAGRTWKFGYGRAHLLTSVTNPRGLVTRVTYGAGRRVISLDGPGNAKTTYQYAGDTTSPAGGATTATGPGGMVTTYHYQDFLLASETTGPASVGATTRYTYNPQTLVTSVADPDGHVTSYTYDKQGHLLTSTHPLNRTTAYTYNALGEVTSQTLPSGAVSRSGYDARGNLIKTEDADGNLTTYAPDPADPAVPAKVTSPGRSTTIYTYDKYGDTVSTTTSPRSGVADVSRYTYDAAGDLTCEAAPDATARHITCPAPPHDCPVLASPTPGTTSYTLDCDGEVTTATDPA